ncbi:MAG TPA: hypothetical protein VMS92_22870 [Mycobacterium sp.]|nr:hypothetical protein [Mycobacterium sp.]
MDPDDEITPVDRPAAHPANKAKLMVIHNLALAMSARATRVAEIAHTIAADPAPVHDITWNKIADVLEEDGKDELRAAASLR